VDAFENLDHYELLGVGRDATEDELKAAWRTQIKQYHPDVHPDKPYALRRTQLINEAYKVLSNPKNRSAPGGKETPKPKPNRQKPPRSPPAPADLQADLYEQARTHLTARRYGQAAATLRELQQINPFYRDSATLLAQAEAATTGVTGSVSSPKKTDPTGLSHQRSRRFWFLGGGLILILLAGLLVVGIGMAKQQPLLIGFAKPTATPTNSPTPKPSAIPTFTPTSEPTSPPKPTSSPLPKKTPTSTSTPTPTVTPIKPEQGELLYLSDFSDPQGWQTTKGRGWEAEPFAGKYRIAVHGNLIPIWYCRTAPGEPNFSLGADVQAEGGAAGLMFRFVSPKDYLAFFVDPLNGTYQLQQWTGEQMKTLAEGESPAIKQTKKATNRLVAHLVGGDIRLFINEQLVKEVSPENINLTSSEYGIVTIARKTYEVEALFDILCNKRVELF
jgi:hypothetical protein